MAARAGRKIGPALFRKEIVMTKQVSLTSTERGRSWNTFGASKS
jgi:hypothetical protein